MSQVATARKLSIRNERITVNAHFHEQGSVLEGSKQGLCDGFEVLFSIDSDEPAAEIAALIRSAHRMCFTESALTTPVPVTSRHVVNGQPFELPEPG